MWETTGTCGIDFSDMPSLPRPRARWRIYNKIKYSTCFFFIGLCVCFNLLSCYCSWSRIRFADRSTTLLITAIVTIVVLAIPTSWLCCLYFYLRVWMCLFKSFLCAFLTLVIESAGEVTAFAKERYSQGNQPVDWPPADSTLTCEVKTLFGQCWCLMKTFYYKYIYPKLFPKKSANVNLVDGNAQAFSCCKEDEIDEGDWRGACKDMWNRFASKFKSNKKEEETKEAQEKGQEKGQGKKGKNGQDAKEGENGAEAKAQPCMPPGSKSAVGQRKSSSDQLVSKEKNVKLDICSKRKGCSIIDYEEIRRQTPFSDFITGAEADAEPEPEAEEKEDELEQFLAYDPKIQRLRMEDTANFKGEYIPAEACFSVPIRSTTLMEQVYRKMLTKQVMADVMTMVNRRLGVRSPYYQNPPPRGEEIYRPMCLAAYMEDETSAEITELESVDDSARLNSFFSVNEKRKWNAKSWLATAFIIAFVASGYVAIFKDNFPSVDLQKLTMILVTMRIVLGALILGGNEDFPMKKPLSVVSGVFSLLMSGYQITNCFGHSNRLSNEKVIGYVLGTGSFILYHFATAYLHM